MKSREKKRCKKLQFSRYWCKQYFALNFFQCWGLHHQTASLQLEWNLRAQVLYFQQIQGNYLWLQGCFLRCEGYEDEKFPDENMEAPFFEPFFKWRMKMLSTPVSFMLYGKLGVDFFSTSEYPCPNMKIRLRLFRVRPNFDMISDNPNVSYGNVDCSLHTRRIALKDDYHKRIMHMLVCTPLECNYLEILAKTFIIPARQNQFFQEYFFTRLQFVELPLEWIPILHSLDPIMKIHSGTSKLFSYSQIRILRGGQPIVDFDAADNCCLSVTTMKTKDFQDDIPSIPIDDFKDHYVLVFDLTSMQDATENCH